MMQGTRSRPAFREMMLAIFFGKDPGPRLVLSISGELPPDGDTERVRLIGELVQDMV